MLAVLGTLVGCLRMPPSPGAVVDASTDAVDALDAVDAAPGAFECLGNSAPTTATPPITLSGTATAIQGMALGPAEGVTLELRVIEGATDSVVDTDGPTTVTGEWSVGPISGTAPVEAYVVATLPAPPDRVANFYPASPVTRDLGLLSIFTIRTSELDAVLNLAGKTQDPLQGVLHLRVVDCLDNPLDGATISVTQPGDVPVGELFLGAEVFLGAGTYFVLNVPPGASTTVNAIYNGMTFRAHVVPIAAGTTTATIIRPGF